MTSQKRNCVSSLFSSVRVFIVVIVWRIYMLSNYSLKVAPVVGLMGRLSTRLPNASQTCSIGAIFGDSDGQCIQLTFCACKKFSFRYKSPLHFCDRSLTRQRYRDEILAPYVVPMFQAHQDLRIFQQDNARPHTVTEWYSCPNHNICATPSVYLINTASGKSFILTSPNPYSTVCIRNTETGFVRKQHFLPL
jgi:hypothetical protein